MTRIRLLNSSIYGNTQVGGYPDPMHKASSYPVIVEADVRNHPYTGAAKIQASELDRVFPIKSESGVQFLRAGVIDDLSWWNNPAGNINAPQKSWEEVSPFDFWNELKRSRKVGEKPRRGYL